MKIPLKIQRARQRPVPLRQVWLPSIECRLRRERWFKRLIFLTTCLVLALILEGRALGRLHIRLGRVVDAPSGPAGMGHLKSRAEVDDSWRRFRQLGIEQTRPKVNRLYDESDPPTQRLLRYAGMDPEHGLLRWANFDWTLLLPSAVFEADDAGRSYRLRALTHSVWLRNLPVTPGVVSFYLVPDGPGLADAIRERRLSPWRHRGRPPTPGDCEARSPIPTLCCAGSSSATPSCRGCSSATMRRPRSACAATCGTGSKPESPS